MQIKTRFARPLIAKVDGRNHLVVTITPPPSQEERKPVACVAVLDRSGSMGAAANQGGRETGSKLAFCKVALSRLVDHMDEGDYFSLVTFSETARMEAPLTLINRQSRQQLLQTIGKMRTDGLTNIEGGLCMGREELPARITASHVGKMLLFSDGEANVGDTTVDGLASLVHSWTKQGISTSTIGVGLEFNSALLDGIAKGGGGDFHYVSDLKQLPQILREEFEASAHVYARNLELLIRVPAKVAISGNLNGYEERQGAQGVRVNLGDLTRSKSIAFEITTPIEVDDDFALDIEVRFVAADDVPEKKFARVIMPVSSEQGVRETQVDEEVAILVRDLVTAQGMAEAAQAYDQGQAGESVSAVRDTRQKLSMLAVAYSMPASMSATEEMDELESKLLQRRFSAKESKEAYARSARVRSSRPEK